jgi:hypothetical protein
MISHWLSGLRYPSAAWGEAGKYVSEPESANTASSVFDY